MMVLKEIAEVSKIRIVVHMAIIAVASLYGASMLSPHAQAVGYEAYLHIIVAGALASAGSSALNQYYDRDIDSVMNRTSARPIPSGRLSARTALAYGVTLSCISVIYSYLLINIASTLFIFLGIFSYVVIYTIWFKRLNTSNVVIGGIANSAASWAGWSAAAGTMDLLGFLVGFLIFVWTPSNFWCLAMTLRDEYKRANIPVLPATMDMRHAPKYILANSLILVPYSLALYAFGMGVVYVVLAAASGGLLLFYHYMLTQNPTVDFARKVFIITNRYLPIIFLAVALDGTFHVRI